MLKDEFAVNSNYLSSFSVFHIPKTYDYSLTSLGCEQYVPNWNYFRFLSAIFISGVTATPTDVNIIVIEEVNHDNIVGILFLRDLETK